VEKVDPDLPVREKANLQAAPVILARVVMVQAVDPAKFLSLVNPSAVPSQHP
jgi:hypothetical protein